LRRAVLLLATALLPQTASPLTLNQLLSLPLERLLTLQISNSAPAAPLPPDLGLPRTGGPP
jgi:hypothetical protein